MLYKKLLVAALILVLVALALAFDVTQYLTLDALKQQRANLQQWFLDDPVQTFVIYLLAYVLVTALSLPGATIMTLGAGAIFGFGWALLLASFASSICALLAFLSARFLLHDWVEQRFGQRLTAINQGLQRDGAFYLLSLRLVPLFPFFVINLAMGLTKIKAWTFYWVSQLGMLLGTAVYVNAGTQLAQIDALGDIVSADLILAFVLLGLFPLLAKLLIARLKRRRLLRGFKRPKRFDNNLIVIGAGSAGLVSAYIAAAVKAKVTLIERDKMGGDCLNTGCVPSKALLQAAKTVAQAKNAARLGIHIGAVDVDFAQVMAHVHRAIKTIEPHDSVERYRQLGVQVELGEAKIVSPWEVEVTQDGQTKRLSARSIIVATGAKPWVPDFPGLAQVAWLTSESLWQLTELPKRLLVLGGGPIGCELAQAFARLGSQVTLVEMEQRLLANEDTDTAARLATALQQDGIELKLAHQARRFENNEQGYQLVAETQGKEVQIGFDQVLIALGRQANLRGFGLEQLGVAFERRLTVNQLLQSNYPSIYGCGDVVGPYQFTHVASHQAWYAAVNALFSPFKSFKVDYSVIPWVTYTSPEIANVGLTEQQAKQQGIAYEVSEYDFAGLDRAIADDQASGRIKVLTRPGKDKILGVNIVGPQAGELLAEYVLAMKQGLGLNTILGTIHSYPTLAEANKYVAGAWKRAHAPQGLLRWVEKFHRWRRGD